MGEKNALPFVVKTDGLKGGGVSIDAGASSQMLSALLMVSAFADSPMRVSLRGDTVSKPFVEMTLGIMSQFGMKSNFENGAYSAASCHRRARSGSTMSSPTPRRRAISSRFRRQSAGRAK